MNIYVCEGEARETVYWPYYVETVSIRYLFSINYFICMGLAVVNGQ